MTIEAGFANGRRKPGTAGFGPRKRMRTLPVLQRLFDACRDAFGNPARGTVPSPADVKRICRILDVVEAEDFWLTRDQPFFSPTTSGTAAGDGSTGRVKCATIYSCCNFSLSLFFIPAGGVIPLHNHPGMTVFSKLLVGSLHIKSYDWASDHPDQSPLITAAESPRWRLARLKSNSIFTSPCKTSVLYPTTGGNIHEFLAVTPCAVLDVMGPPYSMADGRDCSYYRDYAYADGLSRQPHLAYKDLRGIDVEGEEYGWLEEIEMEDPPIDGIEYMGPQITLH
ncbi:hypothetical protein MLD38_015879 [Melastoma candidum]|uniref:Uncharacterized protein n=1 Tax=Melastoma candidum TaxID=119954 RepID=A0ACB9RKN8_9MYRT|nr:hypothetical protein MLD38_015879 [Melastoma candidum]